MPERNLCVESGCKAVCCSDMYIPYSGTVTDSFPEAREVPYLKLGDLSLPGVYYVKFRESFLVRIVGKCPNVDEDSDCGIHKTRPEGCKGFDKDGKDCLDVREFFQKKSKDFQLPISCYP